MENKKKITFKIPLNIVDADGDLIIPEGVTIRNKEGCTPILDNFDLNKYFAVSHDIKVEGDSIVGSYNLPAYLRFYNQLNQSKIMSHGIGFRLLKSHEENGVTVLDEIELLSVSANIKKPKNE